MSPEPSHVRTALYGLPTPHSHARHPQPHRRRAGKRYTMYGAIYMMKYFGVFILCHVLYIVTTLLTFAFSICSCTCLECGTGKT